jgi:hypothetical protein
MASSNSLVLGGAATGMGITGSEPPLGVAEAAGRTALEPVAPDGTRALGAESGGTGDCSATTQGLAGDE